MKLTLGSTVFYLESFSGDKRPLATCYTEPLQTALTLIAFKTIAFQIE